MCADLVPRLGVEKSYQQNKIIWEFAATFSFILVIAKHHLLVRQEQYHKFSLKSLCPLERTKVKKWKAIKRKLYVAFISKNIILKESLTVREGKTITSNGK